MRYLFYPGCSAEASALEYKTSTLAAFEALGAQVEELQDWTCCGASVAATMSDLLGVVLPARNLALAEQAGDGQDLLVICSACYTNFRRTNVAIATQPVLGHGQGNPFGRADPDGPYGLDCPIDRLVIRGSGLPPLARACLYPCS